MKILFIAYPHSVHVYRWINQIADQDWDLHLFPSVDDTKIAPEFRNITVHHTVFAPQPDLHPSVQQRGLRIGIPFMRKPLATVFRWIARLLFLVHKKMDDEYQVNSLRRVIERIKPDIVHSIEFQHAGYLALAVKQQMGERFPTWIATNYGSDIYLFGRLKKHQEKIRAILQLCDYYDCECERDIEIAQQMGLKGQAIRPVLPNAGGFDMEKIHNISRIDPVSSRKRIVLKGYQHFAGRSLTGLRALRQCVDLLQDYTIVMYSTGEDVIIAAELFAQDTGLNVELLPPVSHERILTEFGRSRLYIGLSIADGISTSMLEAIIMGAFPIQTATACVDEWLTDGETGLFINDAEDADEVAAAIRKALTDDDLVDHAAEKNRTALQDRLDTRLLKPQVTAIYQRIGEDLE